MGTPINGEWRLYWWVFLFQRVMNEKFVVISEFMVDKLKLKGVELIVYAVIYGFSQDGESVFSGSQSYLAKWANASTRSVRLALASLVEKGLITKFDKSVNGVSVAEYAVCDFHLLDEEKISYVRKNFPTGEEIISYGAEKTSANNIVYNIDNINKKEIYKEKTKSGASESNEASEESESGINEERSNEERSNEERSNEERSNEERSNEERSNEENEEKEKSCAKKKESVLAESFKEWWNTKASGTKVPQIAKMTPQRERHLQALIKDFGEDVVLVTIGKIFDGHSDFLLGRNNSGWVANVDFALRRSSFIKLMEGTYDRKASDFRRVSQKTDDEWSNFF